MALGDSLGDESDSLNLYQKRFWQRPWFLLLVCVALVSSVVGLGAAVLFLKPFKEEAASYDLNEIHQLESASVIYDKNKTEIGRIYVENRRPVKFDEVPFHFVQALVAAEDSRYFEHKGVDYFGIARAMLANLKEGRNVQGGSTITQQLARKSFDLKGRYKRKLVEAFLALRIEREFTKAEIMEHYLNRIYFGGGFYGINAAAQGYFGKAAKDLTIAESATLCGLIKSPNRLSPLKNPDLSLKARNQVFVRMRDEKMISRDQCEQLKKLPLAVTPKHAQNRSSYVYEQVRQQVISEIGYEKAARGGFQIYTTIDQNIQEAAEESLRQNLASIESQPGYEHQKFADFEAILAAASKDPDTAKPAPQYLQGAIIMIDNRSGAIIALIGGRNYKHSEFNRALQARRSPGTAFKPLVYAAAFAQGKFPGTPVDDSPIDNRRVMIGGTEGILGEWGVESEKNFHEGEITARRALVQSKVAATVRLGEEIGLKNVIALAKKAGIRSPLRNFNSSFIGASEMLLSELVAVYSIFPNNGARPPNFYIVESINDSAGNTVYRVDHSKRSPIEVLDPTSAFQVHDCLAEVLKKGTARKATSTLGLDKKFIGGGKTGTAYNFTDNCFVGYNSAVTCGVWIGLDRPQPIYRGAFSNDTVLPVWVDAITAALPSFPSAPINPPKDLVKIEICSRSGKLATDGCYEPDTVDGQEVYTRSTHFEFVRNSRMLMKACPLHGGEQPATLTSHPSLAIAPRIAKAMPVTGVTPIAMQDPTILGEDPYNSVIPKITRGTKATAKDPSTDNTTVVKPAQVIDALDIGEEKFRVELPPPPAIQFD